MLASTSEEHGRIGDCPQSDTDAQDEQLYEDLTSFSSTVSGVAYDDGRARTGATLRPNSSSESDFPDDLARTCSTLRPETSDGLARTSSTLSLSDQAGGSRCDYLGRNRATLKPLVGDSEEGDPVINGEVEGVSEELTSSLKNPEQQ